VRNSGLQLYVTLLQLYVTLLQCVALLHDDDDILHGVATISSFLGIIGLFCRV